MRSNSETSTTDRAVDVQRRQYALQVAEFNMRYHTKIVPTKKGVIVYDAKTITATTANVNNVYHRGGRTQPGAKMTSE
jgi:ABC-type phosphate/phosphonate transport system ATPase subunit